MILILGGTREARDLACALRDVSGVRVVTSLAGRLREPVLPDGEVRIGGFGGAAGLAAFLKDNAVSTVVDATHPFARRMSEHAAAAAARTGTVLLRLARPGWTEREGDLWHRVPDMVAAVALMCTLGDRVFATTGTTDVQLLSSTTDIDILLRCVDEPAGPRAPHIRVLLGRGPFDVASERALLLRERIDVLLTKDSGGSTTGAKLEAARDLCLPVVMLDRPASPLAPGLRTVASAEEVLDLLGFAGVTSASRQA